MSALPVETIEPDPAATSLSNDETVNKAGENQSAPSVVAEIKESNGSAEVKETESTEKVEDKSVEKVEAKTEKKDEKSEKWQKNGHKRGDFKKEYDNSQPRRTHFNSYPKGPNNSKYDPTVLESTDDHKQIRAQVEFYFGDANLPTDQFLWELTDGPKNLPVPISTICRFGRMKRFEPISAVVEALRQSQFLVVAGEEGQETVKRKVAYDPNATRSGALKRSVYVKGFGAEVRSSQFDIEAFFAPYGPTNAVRLRRSPDKEFKGSVFVEFADEETAKKFLELDPKPLWKNEVVLEVKSKKEYTDGKELDIKEGRMEPSESWAPGSRGGRGGNNARGDGRGRGRGGNSRGGDRGGRGGRGRGDRKDRGDRADRGDRDPDDWKKRREDDRASGFKGDKKNDRRGGRGGRGGNRGGRDDRGPKNDRNSEREGNAKNEDASEDKAVKSENVEAKKTEEPANDKKRPREDDGASEQPAKKVDVKPESTAATS